MCLSVKEVPKNLLRAFSVATHKAEDDAIPLPIGMSDSKYIFMYVFFIFTFSSKKTNKHPFT